MWPSLGSTSLGLCFLDLYVYFLCQIKEVFFIIFSNKFSFFLLSLFSFWHPYDSDVGIFKVVPEIPKPIFIFLNSCFFFLSWLNGYFYLMFQIVNLNPSFLPFTVGSLWIFLYYTLVLFLGFYSVLSFGPYFFAS